MVIARRSNSSKELELAQFSTIILFALLCSVEGTHLREMLLIHVIPNEPDFTPTVIG